MITPTKLPSDDWLEALIREARARQLRRRMIGAAAMALAAAAALGLHSVFASGAHAATASDHGGVPGIPACRDASLTAKEIPISNPTGLIRIGLQFTNTTSSSCSVDGYPSIQFSDARGTMPFLFRHLGTPHALAVRSGKAVYSIFSKFRCDIGVARSTTHVAVRLPGDSAAVITPTGSLGGPSICKPGIPAESRWVTLTPFESLKAAYRVSLIGNGTGPKQ